MDIVLAKSGSWIHYSTELKSKIMQTNHSGVNDSLNICLSDFLIDYDTRKFARELKMIMEEFISFGWDTEFPSVQTTL